MTLYPLGYVTSMVAMERLRQVHEPKMHPEFARRLFPYLESKGGLLGIGGGWRSQPAPGGAPLGKSFHMDQRWASGLIRYAAVDLVAVAPGKKHRSPLWAETADAPPWGLHTFITSPQPEPWHMQPIETRGWQTWVNEGRKDPVANIPLPNDPPPEEEDMLDRILRPTFPNRQPWYPYLGAFDSGSVRQTVSRDMVPRYRYSATELEFPIDDEGQYRRLCAQFNIQLSDPMSP